MSIVEKSILDKRTLFYYIMIMIGVIFAFSTITVGLNIIFGTLVASLLVYFLYNDYKEKQRIENDTKKLQQSLLLPKPKILDKYDDVIKYQFSIQDFYNNNPQVFEEMSQNLESFYRTYEESNNNPKQAGRNYGLMVLYKKNAVNSVHSLIHTLETNVDYTDKLNRAIGTLDAILQRYIDKVEKIYKEYLHEYGYNVNTKIINKGETPANEFDEKYKNLYTYEFI